LIRPVTLLTTLAAVAVAPAAAAQAWPAAAAASGAPRMAQDRASPALVIDRTVSVRRPAATAPTQPARMQRRLLVSRTPDPGAELPDVEIRSKAAWFDDQGLRLTPTRLAFKQRF
jgi:hypothetical protein